MRIPLPWRQPLDAGRLLLLSTFPYSVRRATPSPTSSPADSMSAPRPNASAWKHRISKVYYRDRTQRCVSRQFTPEDEESRVPSHRR